MDKYILENLKQARKNAVVKETIYSYIKSISELLITTPELFTKTCERFGISGEELLAIMNSDNLSNITFLDAIMAYNMNEVEAKSMPNYSNQLIK